MNYYGNNSHSLNPSCQFVCINACFARCGHDLCTGAKIFAMPEKLDAVIREGFIHSLALEPMVKND